MVNSTSPEEWWRNLSPETRDRLAADPGAPVPENLRDEVVAANTRPYLYPPFRSPEDYTLGEQFVAYIQADNEALLASIASHAGVTRSPMVEEWKLRARRRGLME